MQTTKEIISLKNVSLNYENIEVFQDVSLSLNQGDFYYLTGESGVGKTSLLRLIYMDNMNYNGKLKLFEQNIKVLVRKELPKLRRKVGVISQEPDMLDHLSILQNVMLPMIIAGYDEVTSRNRAYKVLSWIGLGEFIESIPPMLSGGQKQTAALARALVLNPTILLADEPTGNLDFRNAKRLMEIFEYLHQKGTTILMATHNQVLVKEFPHPELRLVHKRLEFISHKNLDPECIPEPVLQPLEENVAPPKVVNERPSVSSPPKIHVAPSLKGDTLSSTTRAPSRYSSFHNVIKP